MRQHTDRHLSAGHWQNCVIHNKRQALLALLSSCALLAACVRELFRPFLLVREPIYVIVGTLYLIGLMSLLIVRVRCSHERLWLAIAVIGGIVMFIKGLFPAIVAPEIKVIRAVDVLLWLVAAATSIRFVMSAFRLPSGSLG